MQARGCAPGWFEAKLDWSQPAVALANKVRAFNPWPVAEAQLAGERVRIHAALALDEAHDAASAVQQVRALMFVARFAQDMERRRDQLGQ